MERKRSITLHFTDGTKITFDFPEQTTNVAGKNLRIEDVLTGDHVLIEADGSFLVFPISNIKYVQFSINEAFDLDVVKLPRSVIRNATIRK
ncbi:MAG TPA: hypothetical protein PKW44_05355 [Methylophilaceae bacterium]|nr:hypothetical protein [Methylophilaceae bacterium]